MSAPITKSTTSSFNSSTESKAYASREEAIQAAIDAFKSGRARSLRAAASELGVALSTVCHRAGGRPTQRIARSDQQALTPEQEDSLAQYCRDISFWGFPLRVCHLKELADVLAGRCLGSNWTSRFVKRHDLSSQFARALDQVRAYNHDPKTIESFVELVQEL
jgi:hypothetical protein